MEIADPVESDGEEIEVAFEPRFEIGERVIARYLVRNDGTYAGKEIGDVLVQRGDIGYVRSVGTFLQKFYIYAVEFPDSGHQVGMRAKELCTLDRLPEEVIAQLGSRAAQLSALR
jgi:nitrogen fixation protein NifZ